MSKKIGTKHHTGILMSDLKKIFNDSDTIPVPKGFLKSLEFLAFKANVSLDSHSKQDHLVDANEMIETQKVEFSIE
jgi:hypothetical protein